MLKFISGLFKEKNYHGLRFLNGTYFDEKLASNLLITFCAMLSLWASFDLGKACILINTHMITFEISDLNVIFNECVSILGSKISLPVGFKTK